MAPLPLQLLIKKTGLPQDSQPSLPLYGSLVAGGTFLFLVLLTSLCNYCQRNSKEKKIKTEGVKLVGLSAGCTPQLRPVSTPETGVRDPNRMHCNDDNGLRSWPVDYLRLSGTELSEVGEEDDSGNSWVRQNRELPQVPGTNYGGGKLVNSRKPHDMDHVYSQVKNYPCQQNAIEDSLYESVGTNYEHNPGDRQSEPRCGANGMEVSISTQSQQGLKESAVYMDTPEYASIRKTKKKENNPNLIEKQSRRNVKNGCVLLPGTRNHGEEFRINENYAAFSQTENFSSRIQGRLKPVTDPDAEESLEEFGEERTARGSLIEEQLYTNSAYIQRQSCYFSKSHEKLHSMTDEEIAGMYSKVAKKALRKEMPLPVNIGLQREDNPKFYSWSTGNINEEESDYESIKSPRWHTGSQILGEKPGYAPVNERTWQMRFQDDDEDEEEAEPAYEAINIKWKRIDFSVRRNKAQKVAHERQTENYYESINELQQSRICTRVLTSDDGKEVFITGL
ncbi:phosphoprotein associated with glycosphingolipid-enriched microdomains 1-like [Pristis pectinata]|uniref:phosphoprotein associated with glycosphingolipid-enriched microdomains 1-like n=1 Tax=Pristis pectinata TaxID=685728 RepID=UPI00223D4952|nr:phosphoprotein associated with glycosphingolipid-enriched microdomains 1-like [Pristis pectinata]XP_051887456.1 phosphoprotein associated with glycosphingolipid-enriched microdomains 1-like [Pristis pectinata]